MKLKGFSFGAQQWMKNSLKTFLKSGYNKSTNIIY